MTVIITPEPEGEATPKADDAAFAAGEVVGEFRSHIASCTGRHDAHDNDISALRYRLEGIESIQAATASLAVDASVTAEEAIIAVDEEPVEEASDGDISVIELEMPEIPVEKEEEPEKKKGFHLFG
jgi:hypothetical protein